MSLRQRTIPVSSPESRGELLERFRGVRLACVVAASLVVVAIPLCAAVGLADSGAPARGIVSGGSGDDDIYGSPGVELLAGGRGDDFIEAKDGRADYVACGPGEDTVSADAADRAAGDCETIYGS